MLSDQEFSDLDDSFWESVSGPEDLQNGELQTCLILPIFTHFPLFLI